MDSAESDFLSEVNCRSRQYKFLSVSKRVFVSNNGVLNNQHKESNHNFDGAGLLNLPEGISDQQFRQRRHYSGSRNY